MTSTRQAVPPFVHLAAHPLRWQLLTALSDSDYRVRELVARVGEPQNLVSYHLRLLRNGGLVTATRSSHDGRDSYYHLDLDRSVEMLAGAGKVLHPALRMTPAPIAFEPSAPLAVLFVCTGNSARSAIAEELLRLRTDGRVEVFSAGSNPKPAMHTDTVRVLREEYGIDLSGRVPRRLETLADQHFDAVITLCDKAREVCPEFGADPRWIHWSIPDPAAAHGSDEDIYPRFQATAAEIDIRIHYLLPNLTKRTVR
ncbi:ArsR family transcriptional regulator [Nocardia mangyaensis]|uniref:ArsR family transcriptional regulator n=1 Tax=Nocardia mangyaensis TaxID=2213200 RepID=A0A1J0VT67_9NOCA|nr:ArsR family transcriptional regulator [Nocardia mangyaensis]APE35229.1 ArsR family transcriptional regulator [Nocardia mangyaensis]